ncbi:MAG: glutamate-cysteine ligase family protein [Acidobacteria bacterium]|nr:glutamate-cysteine ligase family protein [Acidobacteriota bacterium]
MSTLAFGAEVRNHPIESVSQLTDLYRRSFKPLSQHRIGLELEALPVLSSGMPVPYSSECGPSIRSLLAEIGSAPGVQRAMEGEHLIGLSDEHGTISLEPGGQVEFSSRPARDLHELKILMTEHLRRLRQASAVTGLHWIEQAYQPFARLSQTEWMPKERYRIMRAYLPTRGRLALRMMSQTASIQCSFDFSDESDMERKFRTANRVTPLVQAITTNSPFHWGRPGRYLSHRTKIWEGTDPDRCGLLPMAFGEGPLIEQYVEYALDVPMMFLMRGGRWIPMKGRSFRRMLKDGYKGSLPTLEDWGLHLSGVFAQVRLKSFVEVRAHDLLPEDLAMAVPALWKGILYDRAALDATYELMSDVSFEQAAGLMTAVARRGLGLRFLGRPLLDRARQLVRIASEGLRRQGQMGPGGDDERCFLASIESLLDRGQTPADALLERYQGEWAGDLRRSIL